VTCAHYSHQRLCTGYAAICRYTQYRCGLGNRDPHKTCNGGRPIKCAQCEPPLPTVGNEQDHKVAAQCVRLKAPIVSHLPPLSCAQVIARHAAVLASNRMYEQIADLKRCCGHETVDSICSVLHVDRMFNLSTLFVTVAIFKNSLETEMVHEKFCIRLLCF